MALALAFVCVAFGSFGFGYWVSGHPTDARNMAQRIVDAFMRLIHRG